MRGDFSRIRFNPAKQYSMVIEQQGRVALDADANERSAIDAYLRDTTNVDVIGPYGGPIGDAGFAIEIRNNREILIHPGRYYVEGVLVENRSLMHYDHQPHLINPTYTTQELLEAVASGEDQVTAYLTLEVWQRLVTWLDDSCLVEPALSQADTTARLQTVWRVVGTIPPAGESSVSAPNPPENLNANLNESQATNLKVNPGQNPNLGVNIGASSGDRRVIADPISADQSPISQLSPCCQGLYNSTMASRTGAMGADTGQGNNECGCQPISSAGYQRLENQLYRVEIHTSGTLNTATFKWSRENGSVVTQVTAISGQVVTVTSLGPDANLGFQAGQWVELTDDTNLFGNTPNQPGELYQIQSRGPGPLQVTLSSSVTGIDTTRNARMRRWDQSGAGATGNGVALSSTATQLENGIEVTFRDGTYTSGDYWTIPARTADGAIDWPPCGGNGHFFQAANFVKIYSAPLACIHLRDNFSASEVSTEKANEFSRFIVDDCRLFFPPLTAVNTETTPAALHIASISWANDDVMTVDTMLQNGLYLVFDNPPTCPWGGGNFEVTLEVPFAADQLVALEGKYPGFPPRGNYPAGTDVFMRTVMTLDPPLGITVSGNQVNWIAPEVVTGVALYETYYLYSTLNPLLNWTAPLGFARVRIRLPGEGVYGSAPNGNMYLDGSSFGETGTRTADGSPCVSLTVPSGNSLKVSDYESWFYLAPSILIANAMIQLMNGPSVVGANNVTVTTSREGAINLEVTGSNPAIPVTAVNAVITLTYPPVAATTLSLSLVDTSGGSAVGSIVTIQGTAAVNPGQQLTVSVPINILANPGLTPAGGPVIDTVGLNVSVAGLLSALPYRGTQPTLIITGGPSQVFIFDRISSPLIPKPTLT